MERKTKFLVHASFIAAIYVVLTYISAMFGLSSGVIQVRFSEMLTVLPVFTPAAVPGLFIGCLLSNILSGCVIWDVIFGSLATLLGAIFTYILKKHKYFAPIPPILSNVLIVPFVLRYAYGIPGSIPYFMATIGIGEIISCGVLGIILIKALEKNKNIFN